MTIALCILLFAVGHTLRDGWPPWRESLAAIRRDNRPALAQSLTNPTRSPIGFVFGVAAGKDHHPHPRHTDGFDRSPIERPA